MPGIGCVASPVLCGGVAVAASVFDDIAQKFADGLANLIKTLMTFWIDTPAPDVSSASSVIQTLNGLTRPLVAFAAVLGVIVGGARMAFSARTHESGQAVLRGLLLMTVVTAAGATVVELALTGCDALAGYVLDHGFDGTSVGTRLLAFSIPTVGAALMFLLALFGIIASLVQVAIMLIRGAILVVLVGVLPVAAAASISETGFGWFKRLAGWITSFVLYKLVAAIVYAAAFALIGDSSSLAGVVSGCGLLIVAILALPALLRLIPPSVEAIGGGGGGALGGAVAAAATGAVALSAGRSGGSGSGSVGPAAGAGPGLKPSGGPSGASPTAGGGPPAPLPAGPSGGAATGAGSAAAGAGGPVAAGAMAGAQTAAAARGAATGAVGEES